MKLILTTAFVIATATAAFAQGPKLGDANPPGALKQGGVPPAAVMRRGDDMGPLVQDIQSRDVSARPQEFGNNPTPTRNDPPGTRTQCRGGCQ
jgi:hypothetical protein